MSHHSTLSPLHTQVLVVAAGAAGINAAVSAARNGAQTLLVEYHGFLGGISATLPWPRGRQPEPPPPWRCARARSVRDLPPQRIIDTLIDQGSELRQTLGEPDAAAIELVGQLPKEEPPTTGDRDLVSQAAGAGVR